MSLTILRQFKKQLDEAIEDIGCIDNDLVGSHSSTAYLFIEDEDGNTFQIERMEIDRINCGCACSVTLIIAPE
jgi:hypothetical protein